MVVPVYQIYQWGINGVDRRVDTVRYMIYVVVCLYVVNLLHTIKVE